METPNAREELPITANIEQIDFVSIKNLHLT